MFKKMNCFNQTYQVSKWKMKLNKGQGFTLLPKSLHVTTSHAVHTTHQSHTSSNHNQPLSFCWLSPSSLTTTINPSKFFISFIHCWQPQSTLLSFLPHFFISHNYNQSFSISYCSSSMLPNTINPSQFITAFQHLASTTALMMAWSQYPSLIPCISSTLLSCDFSQSWWWAHLQLMLQIKQDLETDTGSEFWMPDAWLGGTVRSKLKSES